MSLIFGHKLVQNDIRSAQNDLCSAQNDLRSAQKDIHSHKSAKLRNLSLALLSLPNKSECGTVQPS